jgi:transcription elongation GreA/GreB family factor
LQTLQFFAFFAIQKKKMTLKQKIHAHCLQIISDKLRALQQLMSDLKDSAANETKSTAGDKHETALAMLQIEQANVGAQIQDITNKKAAIEKLDPSLPSNKILNGSLVKTSKGYLYISIALPKMTIEGITITPLSPQSPLGMQLMGLSSGDTATINNNSYIVESIA